MRYPPPDTFKPMGFWVSEGNEWPDWCADNYSGGGSHGYRVAVDMGDVLLLDTVDKLTAFNDEFGFIPEWMKDYSTGRRSSYVDWRVVQDTWSGIVISPYHWSKRLDMLWYYGWDVASGCIWNLDAIAHIEPLTAAHTTSTPTHQEEA